MPPRSSRFRRLRTNLACAVHYLYITGSTRVLLALLGALCVWWTASTPVDAQTQHRWLNAYRRDAGRLIKAASSDDFAYRRLAELTDTYGARLSGSDNLARAIAWAAETMKADGLENVRLERVMVPRWIRGHETAEIIDPPAHPLALLGLGGSVATPPGGIEADVLLVGSFDELQSKAAEARGRIVVFNAPFTTYSDTVAYRTNGARMAAQHGAVAALVRAVGPTGLRTPHTGSVQYTSGQAGIPAAAIAAEDANRIARLIARGRRVRLRLVMEGRYESDAESANVVGEIRGARQARRGGAARWPHRLLGRRHRRLRRRRRLHRHVGGAATDEGAWHPAQTHDPRRAVDERGERIQRSQCLCVAACGERA